MKITRERAQELIDKYIQTDWLKIHMRETEVIMRALAKKLGEDYELWGLTGLLHDLDMDIIDVKDPREHGKKTCEILKKEDDSKEMLDAIQAHCESLGFLGVQRKTKLDYALAASENLSGFLVACTLVMPDKKIASVKTESVIKKLKKKDFAKNVNREFIYDIEKVGTDLEDFIALAMDALKDISDEVGL